MWLSWVNIEDPIIIIITELCYNNAGHRQMYCRTVTTCWQYEEGVTYW